VNLARNMLFLTLPEKRQEKVQSSIFGIYLRGCLAMRLPIY
jgi:hypothetical protein